MSITYAKLTRAAAVAAILSGVLYVGIQFIHPDEDLATVTTDAWAVVAWLTVAMALLALVRHRTSLRTSRPVRVIDPRRNAVSPLLMRSACGHWRVSSPSAAHSQAWPTHRSTTPWYRTRLRQSHSSPRLRSVWSRCSSDFSSRFSGSLGVEELRSKKTPKACLMVSNESPHRVVCHLDRLLVEHEMTLVELSEIVDITVANLSILKNDRAKAIRFSTLTAICDALGAQPGDLFSVTEATR